MIAVVNGNNQEGQRVSNLIQSLGDAIVGVLRGFDRLVFKGAVRRFMFPDGAMNFLASQGVLNKDFKSWAQEQTGRVIGAVEHLAKESTGRGITFIPSSHERKEDLVRKRQAELGISEGIIGAWSCVEAGQTYRACFDGQKGFPQLRWDQTRCKHLYVYTDHPVYGLLYLRLQTWFPYQVQIGMNGREWLRRKLEMHEVPFQLSGNKFLGIADFAEAQRHLDRQPTAYWPGILDRLLAIIFPDRRKIIGKQDYYWTLWQSEWATDLICQDVATARSTVQGLVAQSLATGASDRILHYLARPVTAAGLPHARNSEPIQTRIAAYHDGYRIRHWAGKNSIKVYNEQNVVRIETTVNDPSKFQDIRGKQGDGSAKSRKRRPLRKGVADTALRAAASDAANQRLIQSMGCLTDATPLATVLEPATRKRTRNGRQARGLEPLGKDRELLRALADQRNEVAGFSNAELRETLKDSAWASGRTRQQLTARLSRHLRLLRDHGLIRKLPNQRRYLLTQRGRQMTAALSAALNASTQELMKIAA
jgi:hypothetical protein